MRYIRHFSLQMQFGSVIPYGSGDQWVRGRIRRDQRGLDDSLASHASRARIGAGSYAALGCRALRYSSRPTPRRARASWRSPIRSKFSIEGHIFLLVLRGMQWRFVSFLSSHSDAPCISVGLHKCDCFLFTTIN